MLSILNLAVAFLAGVTVSLAYERIATRKLRELTRELQQMSDGLRRAGQEIHAAFINPHMTGWTDEPRPTVDEARQQLAEHPRATRDGT